MKYVYILVFTVFTFQWTTAQQQSCSCCTEYHDDFDFWLGEWNVINPNGTKAGFNKITKTEGDCIVKENWTSANAGYTGTSYNFYNLKTKQWEQIWIDNQGASLHLKGNRVGNQMILRTDDEKNANGETFYHQVTWTANEDGSVRQLWETYTEGKPVATAFDGLYKKKE